MARSQTESAVKVLTGVMNENLPGQHYAATPPCRIPLGCARGGGRGLGGGAAHCPRAGGAPLDPRSTVFKRAARSFSFRTPKRTAAFSYHGVLEKGLEMLTLRTLALSRLFRPPTPPPCPALDGRSCPMNCHGFVQRHSCYLLAARLAREPVRPEFCEAKTRRGTSCRQRPLKGKRRCRLHGGRSTGPRTAAGRARIAEAQRARHAVNRDLGLANVSDIRGNGSEDRLREPDKT